MANEATLGSTNCNMGCGGAKTLICGGRSALSLWEYTPSAQDGISSVMSVTSSMAAASSKSISSSVTTSSAGATSSVGSSYVVSSVASSATAAYDYLGCFPELSGGRLLSLASTVNSTMTPSLCQRFCSSPAINLPLSGIEYGTECFCELALPNATYPLDSAACIMSCPGASTLKCGGSGALNVYNNTLWTPEPSLSEWKNLGCYTEGTG